MSIMKMSVEFYEICRTKTAKIELTPEERKMLLWIDNSPFHYLPTEKMTDDEMMLAETLLDKRLIDLIPANHSVRQEYIGNRAGPRLKELSERKLPQRYVLLAAGSHAIGTFEQSSLKG